MVSLWSHNLTKLKSSPNYSYYRFILVSFNNDYSVANRWGSKTANSTSKNFTFQQGNLWKSFENEYLTFHTFDDSQCSVQMKPNTCISSDIDCQEKKVQKKGSAKAFLLALPRALKWGGPSKRCIKRDSNPWLFLKLTSIGHRIDDWRRDIDHTDHWARMDYFPPGMLLAIKAENKLWAPLEAGVCANLLNFLKMKNSKYAQETLCHVSCFSF